MGHGSGGFTLRGAGAVQRRVDGQWTMVAKRCLDVSIAGFLCLVLIPAFISIAIGIRLESAGPSFYRSRRVGRGGRVFTMVKFRKMRHGATGPALTASGDDRFTRVGAFLARTKLDELPQLWNVLRGDMSLIGPRPEDPEFVARYPMEFDDILRVRPGITGFSQLAFAKEHQVLDRSTDPIAYYVDSLLPQKIMLDRLYLISQSVYRDLSILVWTVLTVIGKVDVSVNRANGRLTVRRRSRQAQRSAGAVAARS